MCVKYAYQPIQPIFRIFKIPISDEPLEAKAYEVSQQEAYSIGLFVVTFDDIPHQPLVFRPLDGRTTEEFAILLDGQVAPIGGRHGQQLGRRTELGNGRGQGMVVGTGAQAAVATVEAFRKMAPHPFGQLSAMLYGEVRKATARVQSVLGEGTRGTGIEAASACFTQLEIENWKLRITIHAYGSVIGI